MPRPADETISASDGRSALRQIPSVHDVAASPRLAAWAERVPRPVIVQAVQAVLAEHRVRLGDGREPAPTPSVEEFAQRTETHLEASERPPLTPAINGTGIIIHTGLGRAPLAAAAARAMHDVGLGYAAIELDLASGERGRRSSIVRELLTRLTGAESATVVNNNAAALTIALHTLSCNRAVVVSRGELIEIGGSFRLPDVMATSGARLHEVGTTNKTRRTDYERALDETTGAILKVHPSNYRVEGFTESVSIEELAAIGHGAGVPVIHDIGSGALVDLERFGIPHEPHARASIEAGADLVLFSGDKLLGGPQAGIIVGRSALVERIERNPIMRTLRVDKLVLAALAVTLQLHRDPDHAARSVPVLAMVTAPLADLERRGRALVERLSALEGIAHVETHHAQAFLGGGSLPTHGVASLGIEVRAVNMSEEILARRLRTGQPPVMPRVQGGAVRIDLRTVFPEQDDALVAAIRVAVRGEPTTGERPSGTPCV